MVKNLAICLILLFAFGFCGKTQNNRPQGPEVVFDPSDNYFFAMPYPDSARIDESGRLDMHNFPYLDENKLLRKYINIIEEEASFSTYAPIYLTFTEKIDTSTLPESELISVSDISSMFLLDIVDKTRIPIRWHYQETASTYMPEGVLAVAPARGFVLKPDRLHALILTNKIEDVYGNHLVKDDMIYELSNNMDPENLNKGALKDYQKAWDVVSSLFDPDDISHIVVFRTYNVTKDAEAMFYTADETFMPEIVSEPALSTELSNMYVLEGRFKIPIFQRGTPPYYDSGGDVQFDGEGNAIIDHDEDIRFALTIPKNIEDNQDVPLLIYAHGTGGDYMTYIRAKVATNLSDVGIAASGIDQPLHGERNPTGSEMTEELFFNYHNPIAAKYNVLQSAVESMILMKTLSGKKIAVKGKEYTLSDHDLFFFGHSQGSITGSIFIAMSSRIRASLLSGCGGGLGESLIYKTKPTPIKDLLKALMYIPQDEELGWYDPLLMVIQTVSDPADPINFGDLFLHKGDYDIGNNLLMTEGLQDGYVPPFTTEALSFVAHIPFVEPVSSIPETASIAGIKTVDPPVTGNVELDNGIKVTAGLLQFPDYGHFAVFDSQRAIDAYKTFFSSAKGGNIPTIP